MYLYKLNTIRNSSKAVSHIIKSSLIHAIFAYKPKPSVRVPR